MKENKEEVREIKRKERPGFNAYYNKTVLETLNLIIENDDIWLSSIELANISGRTHDNVLKDIRRDILDVYDNLGIHTETLGKTTRYSKNKLVKSHELPKTFLSDIVTEVEALYNNLDTFQKDVVKDIKIKTMKRKTPTGDYYYYHLNRTASLMCLMRYSPVVRAYISNLFLKTADMLKSKGYEVKSVEDMYMSIDEEINNSIDTLESDLDEDGLLSEFNMWHLLWLLLRKIPKSITKYFAKEFPSFYTLHEMAQQYGDFTSPHFEDPDKKGKGGF